VGEPAALLMARLQATLRAFVLELPSLAALASKLHKVFRTRGLENRFGNLVYLELEPGSSRIRGERGAHASAGRLSGPGPAAARGRRRARHPRSDQARGAIGRSGWRPVPGGVLGRRERARGEAGADSDYDVLLVVPDDAPAERKRSKLAYQALRGTGVTTDVFVWTRRAFEARRHIPASLPAAVEREGTLLVAG